MGKCIGKLLTELPDKQFFKLPGITSDEFHPLLKKQHNTFFISAIYYFIVLKQLWSIQKHHQTHPNTIVWLI